MKIYLTRFLEIQGALKTKAGQDLADVLNYLATFTEVMVRLTKGNISFSDNFNSSMATVSLTHGTPQVIQFDSGKTVAGVFAVKGCQSVSWYMNQSNELTVVPYFQYKDDFEFTDASVDAVNDRIYRVNHGFSNNNVTYFDSNGTLPSPLAAGTKYYIVGATASYFQLATTPNGSAVNLVAGTGLHRTQRVNTASSCLLVVLYV